MRYIDLDEIAGEPVAVAQFGGDPFAVEGDAIAQVNDEIENAEDLIELISGDDEFEIECAKLDCYDIKPKRVFLAYTGYNEPYFSFALEFDF
ncbi:MAG: hypothetical protein HDS36_00990 [Bacteroides sp.]|nr:hypothetical protein [Bacteroides sp.]